jgi:Mg2+/Co2+ transporter CorB
LDALPVETLLAALVVLLLVSGFFSIAETSMMALNRYRLKALARTGQRAARLTSSLLERTDKLLGVVLLGNNLVNAATALLVGLIAEHYLGESELSLVIATTAAAFLILVFSEITPKIVGATYPERIALPASFVLTPLLRLTYPVVWFVNLFVQAILYVLRLKPRTDRALQRMSPEELRTLVLEAGQRIPAKHQSILLNLFDLERITVEDVMRPRAQIEALDLESPADALASQIATCYHTRLPVCRGSPDEVVGILHVRRALGLVQRGEVSAAGIEALLTEPYFVPASTPLLTQIQRFQEARQRLALVVDEYGELLGLVTLEDLLEELIGEFTTSAPSRGGGITPQPDGSVLVEGTMPLRDLNRKLGLQLPLGGPKTLNGLILETLRDIPEPGTSLRIGRCALEVVQTQDRAVKVVRVFEIAPPSGPAPSVE